MQAKLPDKLIQSSTQLQYTCISIVRRQSLMNMFPKFLSTYMFFCLFHSALPEAAESAGAADRLEVKLWTV